MYYQPSTPPTPWYSTAWNDAAPVATAGANVVDAFFGISAMKNDVSTLGGNGSAWEKVKVAADLTCNAGMDISMLFGIGEELRGGE